MNDEVFSQMYSAAYDAFYQEKNYEAECDRLEKVINQFGKDPLHTILDLGCGTGSHAIPLARRGYEVLGIDRSQSMLSIARQKSGLLAAGEQIKFQQGDLRTVQLNRRFDVVIMMFAVLGYQTKNEALLMALKTVRDHLRPGGLFIFDVWFGPAVLSERPGQRTKIISTESGKILRIADSDLHTLQQCVTVNYTVWHIENKQITSETKESHTMRFFFPQELDFFLTSAGMDPVHQSDFYDLDRLPDETTWNILKIARLP